MSNIALSPEVLAQKTEAVNKSDVKQPAGSKFKENFLIALGAFQMASGITGAAIMGAANALPDEAKIAAFCAGACLVVAGFIKTIAGAGKKGERQAAELGLNWQKYTGNSI